RIFPVAATLRIFIATVCSQPAGAALHPRAVVFYGVEGTVHHQSRYLTATRDVAPKRTAASDWRYRAENVSPEASDAIRHASAVAMPRRENPRLVDAEFLGVLFEQTVHENQI